MIPEVTTPADRYTGNGSTTAFVGNFRIDSKSEVEVLSNDTVKTVDTDYTVSGIGGSTFTVTYTAAPASGVLVTLLRKQPLKQVSDYVANEDFPSDRMETDLDKIVKSIQMLSEQIARAVLFKKKSTISGKQMDDPLDGKFIKWDAALGRFVFATPTNAGALTSPVAIADGGTGAITVAGAQTNLDIIAKSIVDVKGDIIAATAADTVARFAKGSDGFVIGYDAAQAAGLLVLPPYLWGTSRLVLDSANQISLGVGLIPLKIGGVWQIKRLAAAIIIANTGLVANTVYNVYAYDNAGTATLELSTTGHSTDTDWGIEVKTGDATRTLVGKIRTEGSTPGLFVDSTNRRFVRSWFSDPGVNIISVYSANRTTTSTTFVEINSEIRGEIILWANEIVAAYVNSIQKNDTGAAQTLTTIGFDGATASEASGITESDSAEASRIRTTTPFLFKSGLLEGYHYITLLGRTTAGTSTWIGGTTIGERTTLGAYTQR